VIKNRQISKIYVTGRCFLSILKIIKYVDKMIKINVEIKSKGQKICYEFHKN